MNNIKAAFFDFDWTLFDHKTRSFILSAIESINKAQENGLKIFINSARSFYSLKGLETFSLFNFDGFIVSNGGACMVGEKTLYAHYLNKEIIEKIIEICRENDISYMISTTKNSYIEERNTDNIKAFYSVFYETYPLSIKQYENEDILIIQVFCDESKDYLFKGLKNVKSNRFCENVIEFTAKEFVKSEGVKAVLEYFNLDPQECAAFGDDLNDIDMFELVKYGVCMGNGKEEAKKHAYHITTNIEDDGIKNALQFLKLI